MAAFNCQKSERWVFSESEGRGSFWSVGSLRKELMEGHRGSWALEIRGREACWDYHNIQPHAFQEKLIQQFIGCLWYASLESERTGKTEVMPTGISQSSELHAPWAGCFFSVWGTVMAGYCMMVHHLSQHAEHVSVDHWNSNPWAMLIRFIYSFRRDLLSTNMCQAHVIGAEVTTVFLPL